MRIRSIRLDGFLSFAPGYEPFELRSSNVLIGPNAAGKSNLIEALGLLATTPDDLAEASGTGCPRPCLISLLQPDCNTECRLARSLPRVGPIHFGVESGVEIPL